MGLVKIRMQQNEVHTFRPGDCPAHPIQGRGVHLKKGQQLEVSEALAGAWVKIGLAKVVKPKTTGKGKGGK